MVATMDVKTATADSTAKVSGPKKCFHCKQPGHILPECPLRTPEAAKTQQKTTSKYGSMSTRGGSKDMTPIIIVETLYDDGNIEDSTVRMPMQLHTGAEINLCSASWVPMLEMAGGVVSSHSPVEVGWVPKVDGGFSSTFRVTQSVELMVGVVGFGWPICIMINLL